jgi:adenylate cyclase
LSSKQQQRLVKQGTQNLEAYSLYVQGRYYADQITGQGFKRALTLFSQAIDKDPSYASAYAEISRAYTMLGFLGELSVAEAYPKALAAVHRAIDLDEDLAEAHVALGHVSIVMWDWAVADRELRRGIELNPNLSEAHREYAVYLAAMGTLTDALREARVALKLDPLAAGPSNVLGLIAYFNRDYDTSLAQWYKSLELTPDSSTVLPPFP